MSNFGKKVYASAKNNKAISLKILLEEKDDGFSDESLGDTTDDSADTSSGSDSGSDSGSGSESNTDTDTDDETSTDDTDENSEDTNPEADKIALGDQVDTLINDIEALTDLKSRVTSDPYQELGLDMRQKLSASKDVMYTKKGISYYLLEKSKADELSDKIDDLDTVVDRGFKVVKKKKKDPNLDVNKYVEIAIDALENFDKYDKYGHIKHGDDYEKILDDFSIIAKRNMEFYSGNSIAYEQAIDDVHEYHPPATKSDKDFRDLLYSNDYLADILSSLDGRDHERFIDSILHHISNEYSRPSWDPDRNIPCLITALDAQNKSQRERDGFVDIVANSIGYSFMGLENLVSTIQGL